jgi:hypothetical protein
MLRDGTLYDAKMGGRRLTKNIGPPADVTGTARTRRTGIDAARGPALIGLITVHIYPPAVEDRTGGHRV